MSHRPCCFAFLLIAAASFRLSAQPQRAVLAGTSIRVEASISGGALEEHYLARARNNSPWIELAASAGESTGPLTLKDSSGAVMKGNAISLSSTPGELTEGFTLGTLRIRRTITIGPADRWLKVTTRLESGLPANLHSFSDRVRVAFQPDFSYAPSIGGFIPDAQYKAPLILVQSARRAVGIVPDLAVLTRDILKRSNHALDLDATAEPLLSAGFIPARQAFHSVYREDLDRQWTAAEPVENSYFIYLSANAPPREAFREAVRFHWNQFGRTQMVIAADEQAGTDANEKVGSYKGEALWDDWRARVWDDESRRTWLSFPLPDGSSGGAVRMTRWGGPSPSVYLGSWFNSLRTAVGMALYARRTGKTDLLNMAQQTVNMALKAPGVDGTFKCVAVKKENGPVAWAAGDGAGDSVVNGYLGFDMSWTGYWLLRWREAGLPGSEQILDRTERLARFLIARQQPTGMIPSRFDENGNVQTGLSTTVMAETAPAALFLFELYKSSPKPEYLTAARNAMRFLEREVIPDRKWYDYETFWSCSPRAAVFDQRTRQWPANNLALIHAVAAYLAAFQITHERPMLDKGEALLDYLLLYQQSWTNPALDRLSGPAMLLGGFTTQNSDAEWSDARQSLAGNVLLDYYRATAKPEYLERGVEALRAQFPISPSENWAHVGYGTKAGVSSFHWGAGSGMAGIEIEEDYIKDAIVDIPTSRGVGVNGLNLTAAIDNNRIDLHLNTPFQWKRNPVIVFRHANLAQTYQVTVNNKPVGSFTAQALEAGIEVPSR